MFVENEDFQTHFQNFWGLGTYILSTADFHIPVICGPHFENFWCKNSDEHRGIHKDISLLFPRENLPSRFKFKEYCPMVFRNLRERFGIDDQDYQVRASLQNQRGLAVEWGQEATGQAEKKVSAVLVLCLPVMFLSNQGSLFHVGGFLEG